MSLYYLLYLQIIRLENGIVRGHMLLQTTATLAMYLLAAASSLFWYLLQFCPRSKPISGPDQACKNPQGNELSALNICMMYVCKYAHMYAKTMWVSFSMRYPWGFCHRIFKHFFWLCHGFLNVWWQKDYFHYLLVFSPRRRWGSTLDWLPT